MSSINQGYKKWERSHAEMKGSAMTVCVFRWMGFITWNEISSQVWDYCSVNALWCWVRWRKDLIRWSVKSTVLKTAAERNAIFQTFTDTLDDYKNVCSAREGVECFCLSREWKSNCFPIVSELKGIRLLFSQFYLNLLLHHDVWREITWLLKLSDFSFVFVFSSPLPFTMSSEAFSAAQPSPSLEYAWVGL